MHLERFFHSIGMLAGVKPQLERCPMLHFTVYPTTTFHYIWFIVVALMIALCCFDLMKEL